MFNSGLFDLDAKKYINRIRPDIWGDIDEDVVCYSEYAGKDKYGDNYDFVMSFIMNCVVDHESFLKDLAGIMLRNKPIKIWLHSCDQSMGRLISRLKDIIGPGLPVVISDSLPTTDEYKIIQCKKVKSDKLFDDPIDETISNSFLAILVDYC